MSKFITLAAFSTAFVTTNVVHATKRGVVKAASLAKDAAVTSVSTTKDVGAAFWAGLKYANEINRALGKTAEPEAEAAAKPRTVKPKADDVVEVEPKETKPAAKTTKVKAKAKAKAKPAAKAQQQPRA